MRHQKNKKIRKSHVEYSMIRALILHGRIKTTIQRAKKLRPVFEKVLTKSKKACLYKTENDHRYLASLRDLIALLRDRNLADHAIDIAKQYLMERNGGYTRILKLTQPRHSDLSSRAQISIITN